MRHGLGRGEANRRTDAFGARRRGLISDLKDGATIPPKATIRFGLREMGVAPAGSDRANSGHHHLLIDTELPPLDKPIPNDFNHLHFGTGQTEAEVTLKPGPHTLQLLLGDKDHIPHNPPVMSRRAFAWWWRRRERRRPKPPRRCAGASACKPTPRRNGPPWSSGAAIRPIALIIPMATAIRDTAIDVSARPDDRSTAAAVV